jgi:putative membrane protein
MALHSTDIGDVEAAFAAAQARTRAPIACVLARASVDYETRFALLACLVALVAPWPLLVFTELSAHRIYLAQLAIGLAALALSAFPPLRRAATPRRLARTGAHRAALAQFAARGVERSGCGVLVYISLAERYIRILPAGDCARAISAEVWQGVVDAALARLAAGEIGPALAALAQHCGDRLAEAFPIDPAAPPPPRQHVHLQ